MVALQSRRSRRLLAADLRVQVRLAEVSVVLY
jgi:hypothetical protein